MDASNYSEQDLFISYLNNKRKKIASYQLLGDSLSRLKAPVLASETRPKSATIQGADDAVDDADVVLGEGEFLLARPVLPQGDLGRRATHEFLDEGLVAALDDEDAVARLDRQMGVYPERLAVLVHRVHAVVIGEDRKCIRYTA